MTNTKLLIFHPALAPYRVDFFNALARRFDTELVLFDKNLVNQKFDQEKLSAEIICPISYLLKGFRWKDRYFRTGAIRKLIKNRPDVVWVSEFGVVPIVMAFCKILSFGSFKLYTMVDDNFQMFSEKPPLKRLLRWLFVRVYDGIVVTNDEVAAAFRAITPKWRRVSFPVVPILHDIKKMWANSDYVIAKGRAWRESNASQFEKVLLFVGRLDPEKNVAWLIDQMSSVPKDVVLVLVGSGSEEQKLKKKALEIGRNNIIFVGRLEGELVYSMMAMADLLVLPSIFEPYGAVVGEALQWGTPCLVSDYVGAKSLIISDVQGRVYECNNQHDFHKKLNECLKLVKRKGSRCPFEITDAINKICA